MTDSGMSIDASPGVKRRRLERQKEQKTEFDALLAKRVAEKKAKVAAIKTHHKEQLQAAHAA